MKLMILLSELAAKYNVHIQVNFYYNMYYK
jgi:hypothetical protein